MADQLKDVIDFDLLEALSSVFNYSDSAALDSAGENDSDFVAEECNCELNEKEGLELLENIMSWTTEIWDKITELGEIGSPSDEDIAELYAEKEKFGIRKRVFADQLTSKFRSGIAKASVDDVFELSEKVADFLEHLVTETDRAAGSTELVRALLGFLDYHVENLGTGQMIGDRGLCELAAGDGSMEFLRVFLEYPTAVFEPIELLSLAFFNQSMRIPCSLLILNSGRMDLPSIVEDIQDIWQEFFEDVASATRAIPREDRKVRMEVLETVAELSGRDGMPILDAGKEGPDGRTMFSRACFEDDLPLVELLLGAKLCGDVGAPSPSTGRTPLMAAVLGNSVEVVQRLLEIPAARKTINHKSKDGTAAELALLLKRDLEIAEALQDAASQ